MRKIILDLAVTLDGFIEGPNGEIDWLIKDSSMDFGDILTGILAGVDTIFYGRLSYEKWGHYHPGENASQKLKDAYALLHSKTRYVFSTTKAKDDKAIVIKSDIKENVEKILQEPGKISGYMEGGNSSPPSLTWAW